MEKVQAYKCEYCDKVNISKSASISHEYRCYYNPRTKSCASCDSFHLVSEDVPEMLHHFTEIQKCKQNIDVSKHKLRTKCEHYIKREESECEY